MLEEEYSHLMLPLTHVFIEVLQVLIATFLVICNFLLLALIPLVGFNELLDVFFRVFDLKVRLSLVLNALELFAYFFLLGHGQVLLWRNVLARRILGL